MAICELCGKNVSSVAKVKVAGTEMNACVSCKSLGKEVAVDNNQSYTHSFYKKKRGEISFEVISNVISVINSAMGKRSMNLPQLARVANIRESTLKNYLSGKIQIDVETARKLEKALEIKLTQEAEVSDSSSNYIISNDDDSNLSLGDILMKKLKEGNK